MNNSFRRCLGVTIACLFCFTASFAAWVEVKDKDGNVVKSYREITQGNNKAKKTVSSAGNKFKAVQAKGKTGPSAADKFKAAKAKGKTTGQKAKAKSNDSKVAAMETQVTEGVTRAVEEQCLFPEKVYVLGKATQGGRPAGFECDAAGNNCTVHDYHYEGNGMSLIIHPYTRDPHYDEKVLELAGFEGGEPYFVMNATRGNVLYTISLSQLEKEKWLVAVAFNREDGVAISFNMEKKFVDLNALSKLIDEVHKTRQQFPGVKQFPQDLACRAKLAEELRNEHDGK